MQPIAQSSQQQLHTFFPLSSLSDSHFEQLITAAVELHACPGQASIEERQLTSNYCYLAYGKLSWTDKQGLTHTVSDGDQLGQYALNRFLPSWSHSEALSDCCVVTIPRDRFEDILCWDQVAAYLSLDISYQEDLDEDAEWMMTLLRSNLFYKVPPLNIQSIFNQLQPIYVNAGEVILRQGEVGDGCYFIKEGEATVSRSDDSRTMSKPLARLGLGRCFGEDALLNETVRNATVTIASNGVLMFLAKKAFIELLKEPTVNCVPHDQLRQALADGDQLIDVRTDHEYALSHLPGAHSYPLHWLRLKLRQLDRHQSYLLYCDNGRRSRAAAVLLAKKGFQARAVKGGCESTLVTSWSADLDQVSP